MINELIARIPRRCRHPLALNSTCRKCSEAEIDKLRAEVETLKRERDEARARVLDVAQLAGISYEADGVASAPGPHEVILETLREWKHANNLKFDCDALIDELDRYRKALDAADTLIGLTYNLDENNAFKRAEQRAAWERYRGARKAMAGERK